MASQRIQHLLRTPEDEHRFALPFDDLELAGLYAAQIDFNRCAKRTGLFTGSQRGNDGIAVALRPAPPATEVAVIQTRRCGLTGVVVDMVSF